MEDGKEQQEELEHSSQHERAEENITKSNTYTGGGQEKETTHVSQDDIAQEIIRRYQYAINSWDDKIKKNNEKIKVLNDAIETNKTWKEVLKQERKIEKKAIKLQQERELLVEQSKNDNAEIKKARKEIEELKRELQDKENIIKQKRIDIRTLEKQVFGIGAMESAIPNLQQLNQTLQKDIEKLTQSIEKAKTKHSLTVQTYKDLNERLTELESKAAGRLTSIERLGLLKDKIKIANGTQRRLKYENEALTIKLTEYPITDETLSSVTAAKDKMTRIQEELDSLNQKKSSQLEEIASLKKKIKRVSMQIAKNPKAFPELNVFKLNDKKEEKKKPKKAEKVEKTPLYKPIKRHNYRSLDLQNDPIGPPPMKTPLNTARPKRVYL